MQADILERLQQRFPVSSCPAVVDAEIHAIPEPPPISQAEQAGQGGQGSSGQGVGQGSPVSLSEQLAGLNEEGRAMILRLMEIERNYPIRAYMSEDLLRTGVYKTALFWEREDAPEIAREHSQLFFGTAHADICRMFREHLQDQGRKYLRFKRRMKHESLAPSLAGGGVNG